MLFTLKFLLFKQENGRANFSSIPNAKKMNKHLIKQLPNWRKIKVFQYCWRKYRKQKGDNTAHTHTELCHRYPSWRLWHCSPVYRRLHAPKRVFLIVFSIAPAFPLALWGGGGRMKKPSCKTELDEYESEKIWKMSKKKAWQKDGSNYCNFFSFGVNYLQYTFLIYNLFFTASLFSTREPWSWWGFRCCCNRNTKIWYQIHLFNY